MSAHASGPLHGPVSDALAEGLSRPDQPTERPRCPSSPYDSSLPENQWFDRILVLRGASGGDNQVPKVRRPRDADQGAGKTPVCTLRTGLHCDWRGGSLLYRVSSVRLPQRASDSQVCAVRGASNEVLSPLRSRTGTEDALLRPMWRQSCATIYTRRELPLVRTPEPGRE
jgi:hypothetical protein